jgi:hypothetical protein
MFAYPVFKKISRFNIMNQNCPNCGVRLEPEPGFYQGAMFVSYALSVALIITTSIVLYYVLDNPSEWTYIFVIIGLILLFVPWNYRWSRILYLYAFGGLKYKGRPMT